MAEDHGFQAAEGHHLCANNCGFFGSPATLNLCSKCYRDHCLAENRSETAKTAVETSLRVAEKEVLPVIPVLEARAEQAQIVQVEASPVESSQVNRCGTCRKRVGLTGFKCRCGVTCCGTHRYPEQHGCMFDYKAAGKETIARENPVVKAEKLEKI